MNHRTSIDSTGVSISGRRENSIRGFDFDKNKKVFYLPEKIYKIYPNTLGIFASNCLIYNISKENFEGLQKLRYLNLHTNAIETITNETFEDNPDLEKIVLS